MQSDLRHHFKRGTDVRCQPLPRQIGPCFKLSINLWLIVSPFVTNFLYSLAFVHGAGHILHDEYCFLVISFSLEFKLSPVRSIADFRWLFLRHNCDNQASTGYVIYYWCSCFSIDWWRHNYMWIKRIFSHLRGWTFWSREKNRRQIVFSWSCTCFSLT